MRQSRDHYNPKPRPRAFGSNDNRSLPPRPARRPEPPQARRSHQPAGPMTVPPKQPASGKKRRSMLKAAAWRLAKIVHAKPASLVAMEIAALEDLIELKCPQKHRFEASQRGDAMRLANKITRLRRR